MKMKTGISICITVVGIGFLFAQRKKKIDQINFDLATNNFFSKNAKKISDYKTKDNYKVSNSFIEFFDKNSIKEAYNRYEKYLDLGLSKDDAFKCVVEDDRNK